MKNLFRKDKPVNRLIALWLVFVMMLVPLVSHMGSKEGAKAADGDMNNTCIDINSLFDITLTTSNNTIAPQDLSGSGGAVDELAITGIDTVNKTFYFDTGSIGNGVNLYQPNITLNAENVTYDGKKYEISLSAITCKDGSAVYLPGNTGIIAAVSNVANDSVYNFYAKFLLTNVADTNDTKSTCFIKVATYTLTKKSAFNNPVWLSNGNPIDESKWYKTANTTGAVTEFNGMYGDTHLGIVKYAYATYVEANGTDYTKYSNVRWDTNERSVSGNGKYIGFIGYFGSNADTAPMKVKSLGVVQIDAGSPYIQNAYLYYKEDGNWSNFDPANATADELVKQNKEVLSSELGKYRYYAKVTENGDSGFSEVKFVFDSTDVVGTNAVINSQPSDYYYTEIAEANLGKSVKVVASDNVVPNANTFEQPISTYLTLFQEKYNLSWTYDGTPYDNLGSIATPDIYVGPEQNLILDMKFSTAQKVGSVVVSATVGGTARDIATITNNDNATSGPYAFTGTVDFANELSESTAKISKIEIKVYDVGGNELHTGDATDLVWYDGTKPIITFDPGTGWYTDITLANALAYSISSGNQASDESAIDSVVVTTDGATQSSATINNATATGVLTFSGDSQNANGTPVTITATDMAGNETTGNYTVKIDTKAPSASNPVVASDNRSLNGTTIGNTDSIKIEASDNVAVEKVEYIVKNSSGIETTKTDSNINLANYNTTKTMADLGITTSGEYSLTVRVYDLAGLKGSSTTVTFDYDITAPVFVSSEFLIGTTDTTTGVTTYTSAVSDTHKISADGSKFYIRGNDTNEYYYKITVEDNETIDSLSLNKAGLSVISEADDPNVPQYVFYVKVDTSKLKVDAGLSPTGLKVYDNVGNETELTIAPELYLVDESIVSKAKLSTADGKVVDLSDSSVTDDLADGTSIQYYVEVETADAVSISSVELKNDTTTYVSKTDGTNEFDKVTQRYTYTNKIALPTNKNILFDDWYVFVTDSEGKTSKASLADLLYDNTEPVLSGIESSNVWVNAKQLNYTIVSGEDTSVESNLYKAIANITNSNSDTVYNLLENKTDVATVTGTLDIPESKTVDGTKVQFTASDCAGNPFESSNYTFLVDKTSPEINSLGIVKDNSFVDTTKPVNGTPSVLAGVSDNLTLAEVNISVVYPDGVTREKIFTYDAGEALAVGTDGITENFAYTLEKVDGKILDGSYKATVSVKDKATNKATQKEIGFLVDNTLPVVTAKVVSGVTDGKVPLTAFDGSIYDKYYGSNVDVELTYTDANKAGIVVTDNGEAVEPKWSVNQSGQYVATVNVSTEGDHVFEINGTDVAGGQAAPCSVSFNIDKTAPVVDSLGVVKDNNFVDTTKPLTGTPAILAGVSDNYTLAEVNISVLYPDGVSRGTTYTYETTEAIAQTAEGIEQTLGYNIEAVNGTVLDGSYVATVSVRDKSTNKAVEKQVWFVIDNTLPVVTAKVISGITAGKLPLTAFDGTIYDNYYASDVSVQFTYTDANKDAIVITDNGTEVTPTWSQNDAGQYVATVNVSAEGGHELVINGTDLAGSQAAPCSVAFYIDKTAPVVTTVLNGGVVYTESMGKLKMTADTNLSAAVTDVAEDPNDLNVQIVKAVPDQPVSSPEFVKTNVRQFAFAEEADYTVNLFAIDMAGNQGPTRTVNFRIDKTAPQITISGVSGGGTSSSQATVSFTMKELFWADATGKVTIYRKANDDSAEALYKTIDYTPTAFETVISETLTETGEYRIEFTANDWIGHQVETSQTFTIDREAPELVLTAKQNSADSEDIVKNKQSLDVPVYIGVSVKDAFYLSKTITMTGTCVDAEGNVTNLTFDGLLQNSNGMAFENIYEANGIYTINIVATDAAGNESSDSIQFTIDNDDPVVEDVAAIWSGTITSFEYVDPQSLVTDMTDCDVHMYINGVEYDGSEELADGAYTLVITAEDELGHTVETSTQFIIDSKAPVFIVTGVEKDQVKNETYEITVSLQLDEDELLYVKLNGVEQPIDPNTKTCTITVDTKGDYTLEMAAKDAAGNESSDKYEFKYGEEVNWWIIVIIALSVVAFGFIIFMVAKKKK